MAAHVSETADKFSNWLAIGLGAILSLLLSNMDQLSGYIDRFEIKYAAKIYILILLIAFIQKTLSIKVGSAYRGGAATEESIKSSGANNLDFLVMFQEIINASLTINKWLVIRTIRKGNEKEAAGDAFWLARRIARTAQFQMLFVWVQALLTIYLVVRLVFSIR